MKNSYLGYCAGCVWFFGYEEAKDKFTCTAFPDGIPPEIMQGKKKHNKVIKGQVGEAVWTEIPDG